MHDATPSRNGPPQRSKSPSGGGGSGADEGPEPGRRLRADAAANRGRIVGTARAVFAAEGTGVSMAEIARRAGVGLATAFRHFATSEDLLTEVIAERVAACVREASAALGDPDAWRAFRMMVQEMCDGQADDRGLAPALVSAFLDGDRFPAERAAFERAFGTLTERARRTGELSAEFGYPDLLLLLRANAGVVTLSGPDGEAVHRASRRLVRQVLRSFDTEGTAGRR